MANDQEVRVKVSNTQLNKLKSAAKIKTGTVLRLNIEKLWRWKIATWIIFNNKTNHWNEKCFC